MKKWLCFVLATLMLLCVGCGSEEQEKASASPSASSNVPVPNPDLKVEDCYTFTENRDGTYSYTVEWRGGGVIFRADNEIRPASFAVISEDVLMISGQAGTGVTARWAIFCDIERGRVSEAFGQYLAAVDGHVAFLDQRTNAYHVFVCDPFVPYEYTQVVTLDDWVMSDDVIKDFALSEEGVLSVTYATADGDKTITIDLNATEK